MLNVYNYASYYTMLYILEGKTLYFFIVVLNIAEFAYPYMSPLGKMPRPSFEQT